MTQEVLGVVAPLVGLVAPLLVYLAARQRLTHDTRRSAVGDEAGLWERMSAMLDRYGKRADELEKKIADAEKAARELKGEVTNLKGSMSRWKNYALALVRQIHAAKLVPLNPADFGLGEKD